MKLTNPVWLFYLSEEATGALIREPVRGMLTINDETTDYLYRQTAGHPYLVQFFMQKLVDTALMEERASIGLDDVKELEYNMITQGAPYRLQFDILDSDYGVEEVTNPLTKDLGKGTLALISMIGTSRLEGWVEEQEIKRALAARGVGERAASTILAKLKAAQIISSTNQNDALHVRVTVPLLRKRYVTQNMYQQYFEDKKRK